MESNSTEKLLEIAIAGIQEVKGQRIVVLDFREMHNAITKYFVICQGASSTQVGAIARSIEVFTRRDADEKPWTAQGLRSGTWALLDYADVVFHIFHKDERGHYGLEELWADVPRTEIPDLETADADNVSAAGTNED
jgi:ribosome-associated protein